MSERAPEIGEVVTVQTRMHRGEPGRVTDIETSGWRSEARGCPPRVYFRLESVDGSLLGAQGWYEAHEFTTSEVRT